MSVTFPQYPFQAAKIFFMNPNSDVRRVDFQAWKKKKNLNNGNFENMKFLTNQAKPKKLVIIFIHGDGGRTYVHPSFLPKNKMHSVTNTMHEKMTTYWLWPGGSS